MNLVYYDGNCYKRCPEGYEDNNYICVKCSDLNMFYYDNSCVDICPEGNEPIDNICSLYTEFYLIGNKVNECPENYGYDLTRICYEKKEQLIIDEDFPISMNYNPINDMLENIESFNEKSNIQKLEAIISSKDILDKEKKGTIKL